MQSNKLPIFTFNNIYLSKWIGKNVGGLNFPLQILTWIILSLLLLNMSSEINIPILISTTVLYKYSWPNTFSISAPISPTQETCKHLLEISHGENFYHLRPTCCFKWGLKNRCFKYRHKNLWISFVLFLIINRSCSL